MDRGLYVLFSFIVGHRETYEDLRGGRIVKKIENYWFNKLTCWEKTPLQRSVFLK